MPGNRAKVAFIDSSDDEEVARTNSLVSTKDKKEGALKMDGKVIKEEYKKIVKKQPVAAGPLKKEEEPEMTKRRTALQSKVSEMESGLAACLSSYRQQAEEVIASHAEAMEELQVAHDLEIANIMAENATLRMKLGMKPAEMQGDRLLFQQNVVQPDPKAAASPQKKKQEETSRRKKAWGGDDDDTDNDRAVLKSKQAKGPLPPAGTWQPFVAWVPTGSAMSNPEPWKPLSAVDVAMATAGNQASNQTSQSEKQREKQRQLKSQRSKAALVADDGGSNDQVETISVLPGAPEEQKTIKSEDSDDDSTKSSELDAELEGKFYLLEIWEATTHQKNKMKRGSGQGDTESSMPFTEEDDFQNEEKRCFVINPDSNTRIAWDLGSLIMVVYDMIMIPMMAFNMEDTAFLVFMDWTTRLFWTFDMGWSCCTGVVLADGMVDYNWNSILKRYAKTWLSVDILIVCSDWSTVILSNDELGFSRLGRIFRTARVVRLLRLVRMQEIIANITERIQSDKTLLAMQMMKHFVLVFFLSHVLGCGWWGMGTVAISTNDITAPADVTESRLSWILNSYNHYDSTDNGSKYLISLHWAMAQFSGGMDEVVPVSTLERFYAVVANMFAFMVAVVSLSTLTSSLTQQYIIGGSGARQMANLKKYLKQNHCPKNLTKRLCRNAKHAISGDLTPDAVELLQVISEPLKIEMHYEMYSRILMHHPFFLELLSGPHAPLMRWLCHRALSMLLLANGDVVFSRGEEPSDPKMYIVASGTLDYLDLYGESTTVCERQWLAEANLWTFWKHRGTLTANSDVKMALIDCQIFQDICKRHFRKAKEAAVYIKKYASDFLEEMNQDPTAKTDLYDA